MSKAIIEGNPPIEVHLRRSARARRISLRVGRVDGRVTLSLPVRSSLDEALRFAKSKENWIRNALPQRAQVDLRPAIGGTLPFLGRTLTLVSGTRRGVHLGEHHIEIGDTARLAPQLTGFLKTSAQAALTAACTRYGAMIGKAHSGLVLRDARSRWGSCSPDGRLMFSWRLVMAPPEVLDYVAAHEVAHLREMNHGPDFWALVREICPDFQRHRAWLKREGSALQAIDFSVAKDD